jgi:hypothetical protein
LSLTKGKDLAAESMLPAQAGELSDPMAPDAKSCEAALEIATAGFKALCADPDQLRREIAWLRRRGTSSISEEQAETLKALAKSE